MKRNLIVIFLFAFLIRLIVLNQSLWLDEGTTAHAISQYNYLDLITRFSPTDFHPPLFYLLEKVWTAVFGLSEIALRMPSVLFSLATGVVVYLLGGNFAASLFLFNPLIVYYSQEARMYSMVTFLLTVSIYYFRKLLRVGGFAGLFLFNIFCILSFYSFYGSVFLIAAMYICLLYKKQFKKFLISCLMFGFSLLIISPLLLTQLAHSQEALRLLPNWSNSLGQANIKNLLLIPLKFSFGRISFDPKIIYWGLSGIWTLFVFLFVIKEGIKNRLYLYLFLFPLVLGLIFSVFTPLLQYFRFLYLIPIMALIIGGKQPHRGMLWAAGKIIILSGFIILSFVYLLNPQFYREDWKNLAAGLPADKPVYIVTSSADALHYYTDKQTVDLRQIQAAEKKDIIVIPYTSDIFGVDYKKILATKGYRQKNTVNFRGLQFEEWEK